MTQLKNYYYTLDGHSPVPVADALEWARWFNVAERHVAKDHIGDIFVSTVFLGINHNYTSGPPLLFETMVFGGELDQEQQRYSTWEEAEAGHNEFVAKVKGKQNDIG